MKRLSVEEYESYSQVVYLPHHPVIRESRFTTKLRLVIDEGDRFPLAKSILEEDAYVDDFLFGSDELEEAEQTQIQVAELMECGGFHLRKWVYNEDIPVPTKRKVLSVISKLYDPFGSLTPVTIVAKLMIQELWLHKLEWDDSLPVDLLKTWNDYYHSLIELEKLKISRWTEKTKSDVTYEPHGFADASSKAYAANVYIRIVDEDGNVKITLIMAKSKVAPLTPVSIPRLELCAVVLLAKIMGYIVSTLNYEDCNLYCHTDSTVVLAWLNKHPSNWRTFVANRVAQVHELVPTAKWRHVPTAENTADCASRGLSALELLNFSLLWQGPSWLKRNSVSWPDTIAVVPVDVDLEMRQVSNHVSNFSCDLQIADRFSSWPRLLRVTAYCMRFVSNL
ncbi:uncharacterized protein LOC127276780 [Leptopilina boulardi]|uniref:uncharacterized protein LOC127276780 n=1 Tax=Leptopilina boulardi TaxID=63433 RepID=UPI0021F5CF9F|nr:uncharacterized protein LOC127276780 [Leptopilina boulardi]